MKFKLLNKNQQKTFAIILENGEPIIKSLIEFATQQNLHQHNSLPLVH
jgi:hypothetical protein